MIRRLASLHWLQGGQVRQLQRYYQDAMTSCCPSRRTSFPSLGDTSVALVLFRSPADECTARAWSWSPGVSGRDVAEETAGSPKFLGNLNHPFAHVPNRRRQDCLHQTITVQQRGPWSSKGKGSHDWVFRRSIAWLSDSLSTLRSAGYPTTTQDSLPAAGQALLDGVLTRKVPMKGFRSANYPEQRRGSP